MLLAIIQIFHFRCFKVPDNFVCIIIQMEIHQIRDCDIRISFEFYYNSGVLIRVFVFLSRPFKRRVPFWDFLVDTYLYLKKSFILVKIFFRKFRSHMCPHFQGYIIVLCKGSNVDSTATYIHDYLQITSIILFAFQYAFKFR